MGSVVLLSAKSSPTFLPVRKMQHVQEGIIEDKAWDAYHPSPHQDEAITKATKIAYEKGYEQGKSDTEKALNATQLDALKQQENTQNTTNDLLASLINKIDAEKLKFSSALQDTCIAIIKKILENQIKTALFSDEQKIMVAIKDAFSQLLPNEKTTIYLNHALYEKIAHALSESHITVEADNSLEDTDFSCIKT